MGFGEDGKLPIKIRRETGEVVVEERRSWRWPEKVENIQSDSRPGGTHMAAVKEGEAADGESRTATRMRLWWLIGIVKVMWREGTMVSKVDGFSDIILQISDHVITSITRREEFVLFSFS